MWIKIKEKHFCYIYDKVNGLLDTYTRNLIPILLKDFFILREWQDTHPQPIIWKNGYEEIKPQFKVLKMEISNNKILVYDLYKKSLENLKPDETTAELIYTKEFKTTININVFFILCDDDLGNRLCYIIK